VAVLQKVVELFVFFTVFAAIQISEPISEFTATPPCFIEASATMKYPHLIGFIIEPILTVF